MTFEATTPCDSVPTPESGAYDMTGPRRQMGTADGKPDRVGEGTSQYHAYMRQVLETFQPPVVDDSEEERLMGRWM